MKTVFEFGGANLYQGARTKSLITLEQSESGRRRFNLTYGLQRDTGLTYSEACESLGQVILHHLCCESIASNEGGN